MVQTQLTFPDKDKGYTCPCCGLFVKRYARSLNCNMALALIVLYRNGINDFVHLEKLMQQKGYQRCGDASYLIHWKFLERKVENRKDGSNRNGFYKLTGLGMMFVEGKITAREKAMIFNNNFEGFSGGEITIHQALGKRFNYEELMKDNP